MPEEFKNPEAENPDEVVENAVETVAEKDAEDPVISSGWTESLKKFWKDEEGSIDLAKTGAKIGAYAKKASPYAKKAGKVAGMAVGVPLGIGLFASYKVLRGLYEFGKKAVQKGGHVGFGEGYKIGEEMLSLGDKKEK